MYLKIQLLFLLLIITITYNLQKLMSVLHVLVNAESCSDYKGFWPGATCHPG